MKLYLISAIALALMPGTTTALGINCRGSSECVQARGGVTNLKNLVQNALNTPHVKGHDKNRPYSNGQNVACTSGGNLPPGGYICAFLQDNGGQIQTLDEVNNFLGDLVAHGCKNCGSDPTHPGNDVSTGQLTVNYVLNPACDRGPGEYNNDKASLSWLCYPG